MDLLATLLSLKDDKNAIFTKKTTPTICDKILGIKIPSIKKLAKLLVLNNEYQDFLRSNHTYHEENLLHGFIIAYLPFDFNEKLLLLKEFLPLIDNWAVCDAICQAFKDFKKYPKRSFEFAKELISSKNVFYCRFGLVMLLTYFTDDFFDKSHIDLVKKIKSEEYYINMAIAWYFSVLLVKQYDYAIVVLENKCFNQWIHNVISV